MQLLHFELSYSRADHEAWLRGPGRAEMDAARREVGVDGFEDEQDFEEEVAMQMQMFDRCARIGTPAAHARRGGPPAHRLLRPHLHPRLSWVPQSPTGLGRRYTTGRSCKVPLSIFDSDYTGRVLPAF